MDVVAGDRPRRRPRLHRCEPQACAICNRRPSEFGLPPVIEDRDAKPFGCPVQGVRIAALACEEQQAQPRQVERPHSLSLRVLALDGPEGGWRGEEDVHPVLLAAPPERTRVGGADWLALVEDRRYAVKQRTIHDEPVPDG